LDKLLIDQKTDTSYAQTLFSKKSDNFAARFRKQTKENESELNVVRVQYE
jgi:hypothetical protein